MNYLLDTHIALWLLSGDERLPRKALELCTSDAHQLFLSAVSIWEIVIKHQKSPRLMPVSGEEIAALCDLADIHILPVQREHVLTVGTLRRSPEEPNHNDPFDRLLIAQSKSSGLTLLTHDALLFGYHEPSVLIL